MALKLTFTKDVTFLPIDNDFIISKLKNKSLTEKVNIENAYAKITQIEGNKNKLKMNVFIYDSSEKKNILDSRTYNFTPDISDDSENFLKQGYEYLKSLDEFSSAKDC